MSDRWGNPYKNKSGAWGASGMLAGAFSKMFDANSGIGKSFSKTFSGTSAAASSWGNMKGFAGSGFQNPYGTSSGGGSRFGWGNMSSQSNKFIPSGGAAGTPAGTMGGGGKASRNPNFGQFSKTPQVYDYIDAAAAKYGVDANVMQVFIARESSGDWLGNGNAGQAMNINRAPWYDDIYPFIGTFRKTALSRGVTEQEWNAAAGNMGAQVDMLGRMLKSMIDQNGFTSPEQLFAYYFSGQTDPNSQWSDGTMTVQQYVQRAMGDLSTLGGPSGTGQAQGFGGSVASGPVAQIWSGQGERDLSYGFNAPNSLGLYEYGRLYGMDGNGHTGLDIPMNIGENVVSPVSGTVVCGGTGNGPGAGPGSGGCSAFNDTMGQGAGRVEVLLDNGETVIFGHMSTSAFRPGQRIEAGQVVGQAGGMNGGHVHLEWRVRDPSTGSGWRIVDPMGKLGQGGSVMSSGQQAGQQAAQSFAPQRRRAGGYIY